MPWSMCGSMQVCSPIIGSMQLTPAVHLDWAPSPSRPCQRRWGSLCGEPTTEAVSFCGDAHALG